jgi:homoaconitate hydratase family protein
MSMTVTEKILARASGRKEVRPGEIVEARVSVAMTTDISGTATLLSFRELGVPVWDAKKVVMVVDHCAPPGNLLHAGFVSENMRFAEDYGVRHFYNMQGVCHQILPEEGLVEPGMAIVGTDSHTTTYGALGAFSTGIGATEMVWVFAKGWLWLRVPETIRIEITGRLAPMVMAKDVMLKILSVVRTNGATYKALEYGGETVRRMDMDGRLTLCNMAVECGAKNGIIEVDEVTFSYLASRTEGKVEVFASDADAHYSQVIRINVGDLSPQVACPHSPDNVVPAAEAAGRRVDQVLIGTCTGGRLGDYRVAAGLMRGKHVAQRMRCLIIPASTRIYREMLREGLIEVFLDAGCVVCNSHCGPCGGIQAGLIADGEVCVSSSNRNFQGRMGSPRGEVYLSSAATAAATAVAGELVDPRDLR